MAKADRAKQRRKRRHKRVRKKVVGFPSRPRLFVHKTNRHVYAQLIDDFTSHTITSASSQSPEIRDEYERGNEEAARAVGELIARKARDEGIEQVVFDRGGYPYHGRIAAVAEGAREEGLEL